MAPHLYRMLLHSPPVAEGWLRYLSAIRHECALPVPLALREGLTQAQLDRLGDWQVSDLFDARQRAVLALTDAMTREVLLGYLEHNEAALVHYAARRRRGEPIATSFVESAVDEIIPANDDHKLTAAAA